MAAASKGRPAPGRRGPSPDPDLDPNRAPDLAPDLTRDLTVALFDLAWLLPRTLGAEELQADPLPRSELEVMRLLGRRPGRGVNTVARELGLQPSNVSASVRSLVERGLVERRPSAEDRRQVLLFLTAAARAARQVRERRWAAELEQLLGDLPAADRTRLLAAAPALADLAQRLSSPRAREMPRAAARTNGT